MSCSSVADLGVGAPTSFDATCDYCLTKWRVNIDQMQSCKYRGKSITLEEALKVCKCCTKCGEFIRRWPNNTNVYPPSPHVHEKEVADFAATKRDASWLVWIINKNRKKSNSRSALKRRIAKERRGAEHAGARVPHPMPQRKLLSFNKTMKLCEELGKQ